MAEITKAIENLTDDVVSIMIVGSAIYNSMTLTMIPDWHIAAVGTVLMFHFGRKIRNYTK